MKDLCDERLQKDKVFFSEKRWRSRQNMQPFISIPKLSTLKTNTRRTRDKRWPLTSTQKLMKNLLCNDIV